MTYCISWTDCSIQVSEILKHQGSLSEAADLIGRMTFSWEKVDCRTGVVCTGLWDSSNVQPVFGNNSATISIFRK